MYPQREKSNEFFCSESALTSFLIFLYKYRRQYGTKKDSNKMFQKNLNLLKNGKVIKHEVLEFSRKQLERFFSFSARMWTIMSFTLRKPFVKKISSESYFRSGMHRGSFFVYFISSSRMLEFSWKFQKMIISWFWDELWCISGVWPNLTCVCPKSKILSLNDPFPLI